MVGDGAAVLVGVDVAAAADVALGIGPDELGRAGPEVPPPHAATAKARTMIARFIVFSTGRDRTPNVTLASGTVANVSASRLPKIGQLASAHHVPMPDVEVYRARPNVGAGPTVHILRSRLDFALVAHCGTLLAEVLADVASAPLHVLTSGDQGQLEARRYCRHCIDAVRAV